MRTTNKRVSWIITGIFILLIGLPFLGSIFGWDLYPQQNENRRLAAFPDISKTSIQELPDQTEAYINDHFGFRNTLIRRHRKIERKLLNRGTRKVLKGKTPGWFYFKKARTISDFIGNDPFLEEELAIWKTTLEERRDFLADRDIPYIFFVCPDKTMVYPEHLPDVTQSSRGQTRLEQLMIYLELNSDFEIVYPLPELLQRKQEQEVYLPGDTHWNSFGSYIGYQQMMKQLRRYYPELKPVELEDCTISVVQAKGDLASMYSTSAQLIDMSMINAPKQFENLERVACTSYTNAIWEEKLTASPPWVVNNPSGKRTALIIHDSFVEHGLEPLLPTHFDNTYLFFMYIETPDLKQLVNEINPDVVIEQRVERSLRFIPGSGRDQE